MTIDINTLTITQARELLDTKKITAVELAIACLDAIKEKNVNLNALLGVYDDVIDQAQKADEVIATGTTAPLLGIPLALKDNILVQGKHAGSASKIFEGYVAPYSSTATLKLQAQGAVLIGNANMDEFAMGSSGETSAYGPAKNPLDITRVPGGSSSGSAASVAGGLVLGALGTDTAGSVRLPASFCGLVGLYPTYDTCSRYGIMAMGSSLDQVGPLAKTVEDCETLYNAIVGYDEHDAQSVPENLRVCTSTSVKKIGVPRKVLELPGISDAVIKNFNESVEKLKAAGFDMVDIELPHVGDSLAVYYIVMSAEASTNLASYDGIRYGNRQEGKDLQEVYTNTKGNGFGEEVKRRMLLGAYALSAGYYDAYYGKATRVRDLIIKEFKDAFTQVDLIIMPTSADEAFKFGEIADPVSMYAQDIFAVPANIAGTPAITIPSGKGPNNMPLGIQLYAPWFGEQLLFEVGKKFESL